MRALLAAGAAVNAQSHTGMTPVCCAATYKANEAMTLLLEGRGDPNLGNGWASPVQIANRNKAFRCRDILVQFGADPGREGGMPNAGGSGWGL